MDLDESYEKKYSVKRCFRLNQNVLGCLNVSYNSYNSTLTFWNKFQLFIFGINSTIDIKYFVPEFHIKEVLVYNNYLICLDIGGNIHMSSLKFKNSTQTKFKISSQPKAHNVLAIRRHNENSILIFKYENDSYYVSINKLNGEFHLESQAALDMSDGSLPQVSDKFIFHSQIISRHKHEYLNSIFNIKDKLKESVIILVSFDKQTIWYSLISSGIAEVSVKLLKLYTCPSSICDIKMIESDTLNIIIGLSMGSLIKLPLDTKQPALEHLNIALHKFDIIFNSLYYTDGVSMWTCEELFSACNNFKELVIRNVNCFIQFENQIAFTTFENLIYLFPLDQESLYINNENKEIYYPADKVLSNCSYLGKILEVLDKNKEIVQKVNEEKNYLLALSLSNRQDIMTNMIQTGIKLYYNYKDAMEENMENILPEALNKYFEENIVIFSITLDSSNLNQFFSEMLSHLKQMKIHISFHTLNKTLKIHSVKIQKLLNKTHMLLPLNIDNINDKISIKIKLITKLPTAFDKENKVWSILYSNCLVLKSDQFLKFEDNNKTVYLKNSQGNIEKQIHESAGNLFGNLFKIKKNVNNKVSNAWTTYVKLYNNFENILKSDKLFANLLNKKVATILLQQMRNEGFLKCRSSITLHVNKVKATIKVSNEEFSNCFQLKISCEDVAVAHNLRNLFSNELSKICFTVDNNAFVCSDLYTTTENMRKVLQDYVCAGSQSAFLPLVEEFNKDVIGALYV